MITTKIHSFGISVSIPPGEANGILANFSVCLSRQQYSGGGASVKVLMSECEYIHESSKSIVGGPAAWFQFYCSDYNSSKLSFCSVPGIHKQTFFPGSGWFK